MPPSSEPDDVRRRFAEQGFLVHRDVMEPGLLAEARERTEEAARRDPKFMSMIFYSFLRDDPFWIGFASHPKLLALATPFLGKTIVLSEMHVHRKAARTGLAVPWHQDAFDFRVYLSPVENVVEFWVALDDADAENGCLRVVPGSHRARVIHPHGPSRPPFSRHFTQIEPGVVDESLAVDVPVSSGSVEQHDPFLIHGSNANLSARPRLGVLVCLVGPEARNTSIHRPVLLRA